MVLAFGLLDFVQGQTSEVVMDSGDADEFCGAGITKAEGVLILFSEGVWTLKMPPHSKLS